MTVSRPFDHTSLGQDQLAVRGNPQAVVLPIVLEDGLAIAAQEVAHLEPARFPVRPGARLLPLPPRLVPSGHEGTVFPSGVAPMLRRQPNATLLLTQYVNKY